MPLPFCDGNNEVHCCWVNGVECGFLRENDPRATDRRWACGLFLDLKDQFPNTSADKVWEKVHRHPLYESFVKAVWSQHGVDDCGSFKGLRRPDGSIQGQCCWKGWEWAADGTVIKQPEP